MTIEELDQYRYAKEECADLKRRITQTSNRVSVVCDTVRGSMPEHPFTAHTIRIEGISTKSIRYRSFLNAQYRRKHERVLAQTIEIEQWLDTVRDAKIRCIVRYRYIDGKDWREVSRRVYGQRSYNRAYMALARYFTNCS
jgi:hypothetical protein